MISSDHPMQLITCTLKPLLKCTPAYVCTSPDVCVCVSANLKCLASRTRSRDPALSSILSQMSNLFQWRYYGFYQFFGLGAHLGSQCSKTGVNSRFSGKESLWPWVHGALFLKWNHVSAGPGIGEVTRGELGKCGPPGLFLVGAPVGLKTPRGEGFGAPWGVGPLEKGVLVEPKTRVFLGTEALDKFRRFWRDNLGRRRRVFLRRRRKDMSGGMCV